MIKVASDGWPWCRRDWHLSWRHSPHRWRTSNPARTLQATREDYETHALLRYPPRPAVHNSPKQWQLVRGEYLPRGGPWRPKSSHHERPNRQPNKWTLDMKLQPAMLCYGMCTCVLADAAAWRPSLARGGIAWRLSWMTIPSSLSLWNDYPYIPPLSTGLQNPLNQINLTHIAFIKSTKQITLRPNTRFISLDNHISFTQSNSNI
jgi:hypothetical protein